MTHGDIIASGAFLVSIASLCFTSRELKLQRQHNYKAVKPIGNIVVGDYENKIFIRIDNDGIGPLIIKKLTVKNQERTKDTIIDIIPAEISKRIQWSDFATSLEKKAIPAGQKLNILVWEINDTYKHLGQEKIIKDRTDLRDVLKDITMTLDYTDVYEVKKYQIEQSLNWFGRHKK